MKPVKMTKISGGGIGKNPFRGSEVVGKTIAVPTVGNSFGMLGESLTPGMDFRLVQTSVIKTVTPITDGFRFETENSVYEVVYPEGFEGL